MRWDLREAMDINKTTLLRKPSRHERQRGGGVAPNQVFDKNIMKNKGRIENA
jgi:hypothetical protein